MSAAVPVPPRPDRRRAPLSYAQRAIWRAEQVLPNTALHNETAAFRLTGPVDADALQRALAELATRHEVMRCAVVTDENGEPWQVFADLARPVVERVDLTMLPEDDREQRLTELVARAATVPFDLSGQPPLMRTHLFRLGAEHHLLLFTAHHIVVDAWAFGVFLEELAARYGETTGTTATTVPPVPAPAPAADFGDYAAWQRTDPAAGRSLGYWRTRLGGELPSLQLPADGHGRADGARTDEVAGALHEFTIPAELAARLSALGRAELTSLSAVVLTAYCAVLQRYAAHDDLVIGMPVATRNRPALGGMIGPLLNVIGHRVDLTGTPTFREALHRTRHALKADLRHRDTPFDLVVEDLGTGSAPGGRTPLFQLMYAFHSGPTTTLRLPGVETLPAPSHSGTAKYDLSLFLRPRPSGDLDAGLEYRTALLAPRTAAGFAEALLRLLAAAADDPGLPLGELPVMTEEENRRVVGDFNAADQERPAWHTVPEALRDLSSRDGDAPAVGSDGVTLTRAEVAATADRVARCLVGRFAVRPGERVAVQVERNAAMIPLIVGLWQAGAVLVPLDSAMPDERAAYVLEDSGARLLVTDGPPGLARPGGRAEGVALVDVRDLLDGAGTDRAGGSVTLPDGPAPEALAYLMYTSGSTGTPKGVAVPHHCVANLLHSIVREPGIEEQDVLVAVTSLTFDISVLELFAPLVAGARVVVAPREAARDADALGALLEESGATLMQATPSLWRGLLDGGWPGLPALRALSGGEALDAALAARLLQRCGEVWNLYGPTETTIWSTAGRVLPGEPVSVGRPVARTVCYILDGGGRPVPVGAVGELVIGGAGVTDGYWNRPELTSAAFVPDPVRADGGTVYRTGDLARYLPDGRIVVLGRVDQQVKILGHRIELGEVEALLSAHPAVRQAAVVVDRERAASPRLVAFVVPAPDLAEESLPEVLRRYLRERLPAAAVPAVLGEISELPLNTSGKVDRPALTRAARTLRSGPGRTAPATAAEHAVVRHWAEVLGVAEDGVGTEDDFLAAGGSSIAAGRLLMRIRAEFGQAPSLASFYAEPTPACLARSVNGARTEGADSAPAVGGAPLRPGPDVPVPLTDQQRQLWLTHRLAPASAAYNLAASVHLDGDVDTTALTAALRDLAARHPVLAARCALEDEGPVLVRLPSDALRPTVLGLPDGPEPEAARELEAISAAEAARPFDLAAGPLLRVTLLQGEGRAVLLCTAHHLAVDGWSVSVAVRELAELYAVHAVGADRPSPVTRDFIAYAADSATPEARAVRAEQLAYWCDRLAGHPGVLALPADPGAGAGASGSGATLPVELTAELTARLRRTAVRLRVTPFTVLLAVFGSLLGRYASTDDVVVAAPVANRNEPGLDGLIGSLVNTLPVRLDLSGTPGFDELAARTGRLLAADLDRPLVPFDRLVAALGLARDPSRPALAQASLVLQDAAPATVRLASLTGRLRPVHTATAKYDLTLVLDEHPDRIGGVLEYATSRFTPESAGRFASQLLTLLGAALDDPAANLDDVDLVEGDTPSPRPAATPGAFRTSHRTPVHELFRAQAALRPGAVAVRYAGREVGYGELDRWSDDIALRLLERGAGPGRFVAVLLPTGPAQSAAVLGVAKTGAAFAVLDPVGPELRLKAVLADAEPVCLMAAEAATLAAYPALWDPEALRFAGVPVWWCPTEVPVRSGTAEGGLPDAVGTTSGDDALCLVYTSGSTGTPKGIVLPHATLAQFADWQGARFDIRPEESRIAQWAPFTYDAAYTEVFAALCHGATLCVPPDGTRLDPVALAGWLREERITQIQTVPGFLTVLTEALDRGGQGLPALENLLLAGEALPPSLAAAWADRPGRPRLHNLYGPTECVLATHRELGPGEAFPHSVPIGVPIPGREALVLDHRGRPCPVGVVGEIHLRSDLLAGSYHRRPEESAKAYVPDPWRPGGTLYRTGDLGRYLPDGELAFTGRTGSLVKIRGNRVELEEIEALLESHPAVREAAAALHDRSGTPRLVGYAVAADAVTGAELRAHLADRLPAAVVPETVMLLDALPRTRTNKRDRTRLPVPHAAVGGAEPPLAGTEQVVADAWRRVLGPGAFGRHTNFFEAGGDSLLAARLQLELGSRLGREIRLVDVFARPTVAEFVAGLGAGTGPGAATGAGGGEAASRGERRRAALRTRRTRNAVPDKAEEKRN
ncbi:amino acid adenylation domain-containing protein [Streptomyces europaeiscabiei]|uniref:Amino acid adenylation domain-containing protein n=1 Tax=Streptomyces europaeiscabiei TaxID=146819 RepID=A0AAJ2PIK3_9ACTN|nr:non-ribosomal peptide synthetase [Streptomyces europaeiscabiei]MDX3128260.1 amino acid adenylation domain-containing protein [Streptomyces europaeiscabiei]